MLLARDLSAFSAYEEVLISGGGDGTIKIWAIGPGVDCGIRKLHKLKIGRDDAACVFSIILDGNFLYSGHQGGEINIWDLETKQTIRSLKSDIGDVLTLSVCAGVIFCAGENGKVNVRLNVARKTCSMRLIPT